MKIKTFEFNPLAVNTYVLYDETGECVVIDPACFYDQEQNALHQFIVENKLTLKHVINTHLHFDHIFGINFMQNKFGLTTKANKEDLFLLDNLPQQLAMFGVNSQSDFMPAITDFIDEGDVIKFGNQQMRILHIPGHSPGSLVFYNEAAKIAIVGDVIFNGSIGRTDLPRSNFDLLIEGIQEKLFALPDDTTLYPGHGPLTTIAQEKKYNPFVGGTRV